MTQKSLSCDVGFSDAEFEHYTKQDSNLVVLFVSWNRKNIEFLFHNVVRVLDNDIGEIADVCIETNQTEFLVSTLKQLFENVPVNHPFKEYVFLNLDGSISLAIIAESVNIRVK